MSFLQDGLPEIWIHVQVSVKLFTKSVCTSNSGNCSSALYFLRNLFRAKLVFSLKSLLKYCESICFDATKVKCKNKERSSFGVRWSAM